MNIIKISTLIISISVTFPSFGQTDWSVIDFGKEYKVDTKIQGGVAKSLQSNPTFINDYYIEQASLMKGSSKAGTLQKQGVGSVFAEAALAGISTEALQNLISELHENFVNELNSAGLNIIDGEELLQTKYAEGKKSDKKAMIGKTDGVFIYDKQGLIDASGSDIKERYVFRPKDKNVFAKTRGIPGNFYQNLASKETVNMISIAYTIRFADFTGKKSGLSKNSLTTSAGLEVTPRIMLVNPKGSFSWIEFKERIYGNNDWSNGLIEKKSTDGSVFGLSSSADYAIEADEVKYINELKNLIKNIQKGIAQAIKDSF